MQAFRLVHRAPVRTAGFRPSRAEHGGRRLAHCGGKGRGVALIERTAYPRFAPRHSARELARLYTPTPRELDLARGATRGGEAYRLAFLVMLKSFQRLGYFPKPGEVPDAVVSHLRSRLRLGSETPATPPRRSR